MWKAGEHNNHSHARVEYARISHTLHKQQQGGVLHTTPRDPHPLFALPFSRQFRQETCGNVTRFAMRATHILAGEIYVRMPLHTSSSLQ